MKLSRMVKAGDIVRLKRGLYCVAPRNLREGQWLQFGPIANRLYGPSYVSFETALSAYGLIPERVYLQQSAVSRRSKEFRTPLADFSYRQVPAALFPLGLRVERTKNGCYTMANPTKALCDTLLFKRDLRVTSPKTLRDFLEVDMRFDFDYLGDPDFETLRGFATSGIKTGLFKALERMKGTMVGMSKMKLAIGIMFAVATLAAGADDTAAIQAKLDAGEAKVYLPPKAGGYVISKTLKIGSGTELRLDPGTSVRLAPMSNCPLIANKGTNDHDIAIVGGIWDGDNQNQFPSPWCLGYIGKPFSVTKQLPKGEKPGPEYKGWAMYFESVDRFTMRGVTIRNPTTFGCCLVRVTHFEVRDITFDYPTYNPVRACMDGIHLDGGCRFGRILNLKGACWDDTVALNSNDDHGGPAVSEGEPITDIVIDGIEAEGSHSAVRLLSTGGMVRDVTIRNIRGSFYRYAVGLTHFFKWDPSKPRGRFENIVIENCQLAKAPTPEHFPGVNPEVSLISVEEKLDICNLTVTNVVRRADGFPKLPLIDIDPDAKIEGAAGVHGGHVTDWMPGRIGVFTHYLPDARTFGDVENFDVPGLVAQLKAMHADYYVITLGQNSGYYCSPNATLEALAGYSPNERCSKRDIPAEIIAALRGTGIRFGLYLPSQPACRDDRMETNLGFPPEVNASGGDPDRKFTKKGSENWAKVIAVWARRYGRDVSLWWFDGAYSWLGFDGEIAGRYRAACKAGNPEAAIAFNAGVRFKGAERWSDVWAGEESAGALETMPTNRWAASGLQWQVLTFLGPQWGRRTCRFQDKPLRDWLGNVTRRGGCVTLDMHIDPKTGRLDPEQADQFRRVKKFVDMD